ncbi:MAG: hypothetical protein FJ279_33225 [Planctomycetes bacterium]|nr:hypothetical protein [Planctomycetota bacterium]MBM4080938.1 hypothetical protein [Planctomycetota bacterium]MBM4085126.1 hypothetical protein [Planctomycetota bacterium]
MRKLKIPDWISCRAELEALDRQYERAWAKFQQATREKPARSNRIAEIHIELSDLRRQMMRLESAEVQKIMRKYRRSARVHA